MTLKILEEMYPRVETLNQNYKQINDAKNLTHVLQHIPGNKTICKLVLWKLT